MGEGASHRHHGGLTAGVIGYVGRAGFQVSHTGVKLCSAKKNINADNVEAVHFYQFASNSALRTRSQSVH
jgi:hypothetical protein